MHPPPDPMLKVPDEDRCCSDAALPLKLFWRCLRPKCEETPAPCHLPPCFNWAICPPVETARHDSWIHPIQDDGLQRERNWMHTGHVKYKEQSITTNQDLVAWPRDIHVDTNGRQSELHPETVDELITATQTQHFNEGRNLCHHPKIRVHRTSFVNNDVLWEWVLPVSHDQRGPHYLFSLALYLCWTHDVPLIVKHFPACCLQSQTLVARKIFAALEVPENLVVTISYHWHVLATKSAVEMTVFGRNICGPSHKASPNITRSPSSVHLVWLFGT